jgi:hypothetical protein
MKTIRGASALIRSLAAAALIAVTAFVTPAVSATAAFAAPAAKKPPATGTVSSPYLAQLLNEINARRARAGTSPVVYVTEGANQAVDQYLADLTPQMLAYNACFHGMYNPVPPAWDYVAASGLDAEAHGEVLGCPDQSGYWTPARVADGWWNSPMHYQALYGDPDVNAVACGAYGALRGGQAFETIACVSYRV